MARIWGLCPRAYARGSFLEGCMTRSRGREHAENPKSTGLKTGQWHGMREGKCDRGAGVGSIVWAWHM